MAIRVGRVLAWIGEKLHKSKLPTLLTYLRTGHFVYFAFLLNSLNFVLILYGITLSVWNISLVEKIIIIVMTLLGLIVTATALGWLDMNALVSRKIQEELIYWTMAPWKAVAYITFRLQSLPFLMLLYESVKDSLDDEELSELKRCISKVSTNTIEWAYSSMGVKTYNPPYDAECLKKILKMVSDLDLSDELIEGIEMLSRTPEYG